MADIRVKAYGLAAGVVALDRLTKWIVETRLTFFDTYKVIPGDFSHEDIAIGLPGGDFDWWRVLNTWVKQFNASGDNARLFKHWFGYEMPPL